MSRIDRVAIENIPYHITQRGNGRQQLFFEADDYRLYLDLLRTHCEAAALRLRGYCLMPNHIHLIAVPSLATSLACAMARTSANFARYFNLRRRSCGHVWQARYFSTPLDEPHLWHALAYAERNPVRARLAAHAEDYPWSSAPLRRSGATAGLIDLEPWRERYDWARWKTVLETSLGEEAFGSRLQEASRRGRPFGEAEFAGVLETRCGRTLRPKPVGRPKKAADEKHPRLASQIAV